ncbi:hypothetical protein QBC41DRAFT_360903 [Cercophora samala]|uniref:Genetic interactor of prohibitins 3, mitochondrial n=1 Tax=Cercophora samala TaxID=330535 RepID=A0AA39ZNS4_9PEZI|nr:hypothetical protein QBC41DRAFT_360903 [Cercophora samala]
MSCQTIGELEVYPGDIAGEDGRSWPTLDVKELWILLASVPQGSRISGIGELASRRGVWVAAAGLPAATLAKKRASSSTSNPSNRYFQIMHIRPARTASSRWLGSVFNAERPTSTSVPLYLCPAFRSLSTVANAPHSRPSIPHHRQHAPCQFQQLRRLHEQSSSPEHTSDAPEGIPSFEVAPKKTLPPQCTGCGALSQTAVPDEAGYYDLSRKSIRQYLGLDKTTKPDKSQQEDIIKQALSGLDLEALAKSGIDLKSLLPQERPPPRKRELQKLESPPLCDRCHNLVHNSTGNSIYHPTLESIQETIEESPYKYNHVYHIIDAADFPMSLLPRLHSILDITLRTQNRRGGQHKYRRGRLIEMSFIVTRSDLLAPRKEMVDSMMPYIRESLRDALGRVGQRVRLGNVHCVSAKRGWWTKELKEDIWKRGGACWMVGKVNVGKSQLFEAVFPKNRMSDATAVMLNKKKIAPINVYPKRGAEPLSFTEDPEDEEARNTLLPGLSLNTVSDLLPPPQEETAYPAMPIVSSLPGTTASPIRIPFGSGKGELIDLPGLSRGDIELFVRPECRTSLVMKQRIVPEQHTIKPGQSLLIGGFIRITPRNVAPDEELIFLAYAFTPIDPHLTSTEKAIATQTQDPNAPKVANIALPGTGEKIQHAGAFQLRYDITKARTGPLTRKEAVGLKVDQLPYRVLGIDILIEGVGWVELAVQVRTRKLFDTSAPKPVYAKPQSSDPFDVLTSPPTTDTDTTAASPLDLRPEPVNSLSREREPKREKRKPKPAYSQRGDRMTDEQLKEDLWAAWDDKPSHSSSTEQHRENDWEDELDQREEEEQDAAGPEPNWPVIDVFSPEGKFIGYRPPLNAWMVNKELKSKEAKLNRPRRSMKGVKKGAKLEGRWGGGGSR